MTDIFVNEKKNLSKSTLETFLKLIIETLPSLISMVMLLETTSLEARSFATGAYLSMKRSP